jgi:multiple sugar transport system substrate-binding protein
MIRLVFGFVAAALLGFAGGCKEMPEGGEPKKVVLRVITAGGPNRIVEADKSLAILAAGGDLDLLWMGSGFGLFAWRDALLPLDDFIRNDGEFPLAEYYPSVVNWYRHRGALLGLPYGIDVQAIAYNRQIFDAAGVPYPTAEWTFQDFVDISRNLTAYGAEHPEVCRFGAGIDKIAPYYFGLNLISEEGDRSGLRGPVAEEWLATNVQLLREGVMTRVGAQGTLDRLGEFLQGRIAMVEAYTWDMADLRNRAKFPWALQVNPLAKDGQRAGWASSSGFAISARTKHPQEAWLLLKEMVGVEMQLRLLETTVPARKDLQARYLEATGLEKVNLQALLDMLPAMKTPVRVPELLEASQELDYWFELALQGKTPLAEIAPQMEDGINRILSTSPARQ